MVAIDLNPFFIGGFDTAYLPIASNNDFAGARLASVEVPGEPDVVPVCKLQWGILTAIWMIVPVKRGFCCSKSMEQASRYGACRPHLAAYRENGDMQAYHRPEGARPRPGR